MNPSQIPNTNGNASDVRQVEITFTPHYYALTHSGKSQFSRIPDAIAELIDNSIQACSTNELAEERKVFVSMHLENYRNIHLKSGYIVVLDNGKGMGKEDLREFATYSLDQETRENVPTTSTAENNRASFISKFGVGAKQAGFFLGDSIHVFTKKRDSNEVLELMLDVNDFKSRFERNEDVYSGNIFIRNYSTACVQLASNTVESGGDWPTDLYDVLGKHVSENLHFTAVIIKLNSESLVRVKDDYSVIKFSLAEIYHFHLNPNHLPHNIIRENKFQGRSDTRIEDFPYSRIPTRRSEDNEYTLPPLDILFDVKVDGKAELEPQPISLKTCEDFVDACVLRASAAFRFTLEFPDPYAVLEANIESRSQYVRELDAHTETCKMEGILFYFPNVDGEETRPLLSNYMGSMQSDSLDSSDPRNIDSTFSIYWQRRLVPETVLSKLPFFPDCVTRGQCNANELPEKWKYRLKGFIFFDWEFRHISNNKLKIQISGFEDFINDSKRRKNIIYDNQSVPASYLKFLKLCHRHFDREYKFSERDFQLERDSVNSRFSYFSRLNAGNIEFQAKAGIIEIPAVKGRSKIYGKILAFRVPGPLHHTETEYQGKAEIYYQREPRSVFGPEPSKFFPSVSLLDISSSVKIVNDKKIKEVQRAAPVKINAELFFSEGGEHERIEGIYEAIAGVEYFKIGIQLLNGENKVITTIPQSSNYYKIKVSFGNTDWGSSDEYWYYDKKQKKDVKVSSAREASGVPVSEWWYGFGHHRNDSRYEDSNYPLIFKRAGEYNLKIDVIDESSTGNTFTILSETKTIVVTSQFSEDFLLSFDEDIIPTRALGSCLPGFSIKFIDKDHNAVSQLGLTCIRILSNDMKIACDNVQDPIFELVEDDNGVLAFAGDQWSAVPVNNNSFLPNPLDVNSIRSVSFVLTVHPTENPSKVLPPNAKKIGQEKKFSLTFSAGKPGQLKLVEPMKSPIPIVNHESIPFIRIALFDQFNNRTAPGRGNNWILRVLDGPLTCDREFIVLPSGEVIIKNATVDVEDQDLNVTGLNASQKFELIDEEASSIDPISLEIDFRVQPSNIPAFVEVYFRGYRIPRPWVVPVNSTLSDLTIRIFDSTRKELEFTPDFFRWKASGVVADWDSTRGRKGKAKLKSEDLPDITIPSDSLDEIDFNVTVTISADIVLHDSFVIKPSPAAATAWKILSSGTLQEGVMNYNSDDLTSKVIGIQKVDEFGNIVPLSSIDEKPVLLYSWEEFNSENEDIIEGDKRRRSNETPISEKRRKISMASSQTVLNYRLELELKDDNQMYLLAPGQSIRATSVLPAFIWFKAQSSEDSTNILQHHILQCSVTSGNPFSFRLVSEENNIPEPVAHAEVTVNKYIKLMKIQICSLDQSNQPASLKNIKNFSCRIMAFMLDRESIESTNSDGSFNMNPSEGIVILKNRTCKTSEFVVPEIQIDKVIHRLQELPGYTEDGLFQIVFSGSYDDNKGNSIEVQPCTLNCECLQLNIVKELKARVASTSDDMDTDEEPPEDLCISRRCSEGFPDVNIMVVTEDNKEFVPTIDSFKYVVKFGELSYVSSNRGSKKEVDIANYFQLHQAGGWNLVYRGESDINQSTSDSVIVPKPGQYSLKISYHEKREIMRNIPDMRVQKILRVNISAGLPVRLMPDESCIKAIENITVLASRSSNPLRHVCKDLLINLVDEHGYQCDFAEDFVVICTIVSQSGSPPSFSNGLVHHGLNILPSERVSNNSERGHSFLFPSIDLVDTDLSIEGMFTLVFSLHKLVESSLELIDFKCESYETRIKLLSPSQYNEKLQQLETEINDINTLIEAYDSKRQRKSKELREKDVEINSIFQQVNNVNNFSIIENAITNANELDEADINNLISVKSDMQKSIHDAQTEQRNVRPPGKPSSFSTTIKDGRQDAIGYVFELGYATGKNDARILSWAAKSYMNVLVVKNKELAKELYDKNCRSLSLDMMREFEVRSHDVTARGRSEEEMRSKSLPLPQIRNSPSGNPQYLVNLIELNDDNESLRDTVFYNIFRDAILFDTLADGVEYRSLCVRQRRNCPTIYTRDGGFISSSGLLDPTAKLDPSKELEFMFGELPRTNYLSIREMEEDIQLANDLITLLRGRYNCNKELQAHILTGNEQNIDELRARREQLQAELNELTNS